MIVIAEPYARYVTTVPESRLDAAGEHLLLFAETAAQHYYAERYRQFGITIAVRIEIGSTWVRITVLASTLSILAQYGSIREGVDYLIKDSQNLARLILPHVPESLGIAPQTPEYHQRRHGLPGRLHRLFTQVERGELSAKEATAQAMMLLEDEGVTDVEDIQKLKQQLSLEFKRSEKASEEMEDQYLPEWHSPPSSQTNPVKPLLPKRPDPVVPTSKSIRRRRGIVARRDPRTGRLQIINY
jgi:hypothetical protein